MDKEIGRSFLWTGARFSRISGGISMSLRRFNRSIDVAEANLAMGKVAFFTPLATNAKRRRADAPEDPARPFWEEEKGDNAQIDAAATENRLICKVCQKLNERAGRGKGGDTEWPLCRNGQRSGRTRTARPGSSRRNCAECRPPQ